MKVIDQLFSNALSLKPKSEYRLYVMFTKILYYICLIELTFWFTAHNGYPIPMDIFSQSTINKLLSDYYLVSSVFAYCIVYVTINSLVFVLCYFLILWGFTLWVMYRSDYGLINIIDFRSKETKLNFSMRGRQNFPKI